MASTREASTAGAGLEDTVGYVTGGGSAIGGVAVQALLELGSRVVVLGRDERRLQDVAGRTDPDRVRVMAMDVGDEAAWRAVARAGEDWGPAGAVVAVAGVAHRGPFIDGRLEDWDAMWRTNVVGTMLAARAFLAGMLARGFGRIIVMSSVGARVGLRDRVAYTATKGAVEALARSLAVEVAGTGVTVNAIAPGAMPTTESRAWLDANPELARATLGDIPEGRFGVPADLVAAFRYLLSSAYAQGSTVAVDGGWSVA